MHIFIFVIVKAPWPPCKTKCTVLKIECAFTFSINKKVATAKKKQNTIDKSKLVY